MMSKFLLFVGILAIVMGCGFTAGSKLSAEKSTNDSIFSADTSRMNKIALEKSIKTQGSKLYTDPVENYYISNQISIWKTSSQNNLNFTYSLKRSGSITHIDAGDPMKVLVFYKDLSLISFLDNFLAEAGSIQLMDFGLDQAEVVCKSMNNGIWVYDVKQDKLVKINSSSKVDVEILNIQRIIGESFSPTQMLERNNGLYLNDPEKGIFVFDNYGAFIRKIPEANISKFNVIENFITFRRNNDIFTLNKETLELFKIYSDSTMTDFSITEKKLYILNADSLHIYKLIP
ncbi:MAG: hypothetical protein NT150_11505 [Bacteroidetes bacterium]|nr:hypothetical protein [Bacteroidota bacterium]